MGQLWLHSTRLDYSSFYGTTAIVGAGAKSMNREVVIGNNLGNRILEPG